MATSTVVVAREDLTIPGAVEASGLDTNDPERIEKNCLKLSSRIRPMPFCST